LINSIIAKKSAASCQNLQQQRENELVNRVKDAIAQLVLRGEKASLDKVGQIVGSNYISLYRRPHIRELFRTLL